MKKYYIETYGCQMNEYDSQLIARILSAQGMLRVSDVSLADLILINTCAVRENAHIKIYSRLRHLSYLKKKKPALQIGLLGCMPQILADDLFSNNLPLDFTAGPDAYKKLPDIIKRVAENIESKITELDLDVRENYQDVLPLLNSEENSGVSAYTTIMRGCNNFCTFCVVPFTRGRERSLAPFDLLKEIEYLQSQGKKEIVLLGQNVNSYYYKENINTNKSILKSETSFTDLIKIILEQTSVERIRFTSPHPKDFPEELLALMAKEKRLCSHIHLPLQAGNNRILNLMKRGYSSEEFVKLAKSMREKIPNLAITTDIIVAFPGETELEFQDTLDVMKEVRFDSAFMFAYSQRKNTLAAKSLKDDVEDSVKQARLETTIALQNSIAKEVNTSIIGKNYEVLVEGFSRRSKSFLRGKSLNNKTVIFPKENFQMGDFVQVKIEKASSATLQGSII